MPFLPRGSLVLVTGASCFVGTHTVAALLAAGFKVRVTDSQQKLGQIHTLFPDVECFVVNDITRYDAYDEAIEGVEGIINLAFQSTTCHIGDHFFLERAVRGVTSLLNSVGPLNRTVKRIVHISSIASAGRYDVPGPICYTEKDWNDQCVDIVELKQAAAPGSIQYCASKTLAETAFWEWIRRRQPLWDGVALLPGCTIGPPTHDKPLGLRVDHCDPLVLALFEPFLSNGAPQNLLNQSFGNFVDRRDVADACVKAMRIPEASGERFIISGTPLWGNDFALAANHALPQLVELLHGNEDVAFRAELDRQAVYFDGSKATHVLGLKYRSKDESMAEAVGYIFKQIQAAMRAKHEAGEGELF
ncbi:hypothetical protein Q8F55_007991 [Vanrija albida]|uniref:NAD-dependent epimerase/dehydratase domain-containing protein n=1 Tax=Vanrija albida TaxID=181172 RepID=A0ABR3PV76_9TREE